MLHRNYFHKFVRVMIGSVLFSMLAPVVAFCANQNGTIGSDSTASTEISLTIPESVAASVKLSSLSASGKWHGEIVTNSDQDLTEYRVQVLSPRGETVHYVQANQPGALTKVLEDAQRRAQQVAANNLVLMISAQ